MLIDETYDSRTSLKAKKTKPGSANLKLVQKQYKNHEHMLKVKKGQKERYSIALNGLTDMGNLTNLQIRGVSQLKKEMAEQRNCSKNLNMLRLHVNEITQEQEGLGYHIQENIIDHLKQKVAK